LSQGNRLGKGAAFQILLCLVLPFCLSSVLQASGKQGTFELVYGRFTPRDAKFKKVYHKGGGIQGLALSGNLVANVNLYLEVKSFYRTGELTVSKAKTKFLLLPLSVGVRYIYPTRWFLPYAGIGTDFFFYYEDNPIGTVANYAPGYHILGGTYIRASESFPFWLNLKLKYTKAQATYQDRTLELGGVEYAVGLALAF
jgi:hypothetical protein